MKKKLKVLVLAMIISTLIVGCGAKKYIGQYIKIDKSDIYLETADIGKGGYVNLFDLGDYLNPSPDRFSYKVNKEDKIITIQEGQFMTALKGASENNAKSSKFTLVSKDKEEKVRLLDDNGNYYLKVDHICDLLGFTYDLVEENIDGQNVLVYHLNLPTEDTKSMAKSNNRSYDWFMDQAHTGECSDGNCGPTSMAMIKLWLDEDSEATGESLRDEIYNNGEWWSTNIFERYFKDNNIDYKPRVYDKPEVLTQAIDNDSIVLVCLQMSGIRRSFSPDATNKDRFYEFSGGHFLLVKGYTIEDGKLYFEVYDPNNWDMTYDDGQPLGKDRLYSALDMNIAINSWWTTVYEIFEKQ